jgi:hypothetical protein
MDRIKVAIQTKDEQYSGFYPTQKEFLLCLANVKEQILVQSIEQLIF